jgi:hypothetical protein
MPEKKSVDLRSVTHGGGVIRIEVWQDTSTGICVRYNFAYVNGDMSALDNGRVVGFDDAHHYPGFTSRHHRHWMGKLYENKAIFDLSEIDRRFDRFLRKLRRIYGRKF